MVTSRVLRVALLAALIPMCYGCGSAPTPAPNETGAQPEVIVLKHVDCNVALASVRELNEGMPDGSKIVVVAHESSNSLLLSGPPEVMAEAKDLVTKLDTATK